jgi:deoxyadenosine/deoxycytidine kinase
MRVSIVGNIGCGKSTLLAKLEEKGLKVMYEPVSSWTTLSLFYKDMNRWAFPLQVQILNSFYNSPENMISERSPWEAQHIFAKNLMDQGVLAQEEYDLMGDLIKNIGWLPDIFIYIKTDPDKCFERVLSRKRECESSVPLEYLKSLDSLYEYESKIMPFITVDGNQSADKVFEEVEKIVVSKI